MTWVIHVSVSHHYSSSTFGGQKRQALTAEPEHAVVVLTEGQEGRLAEVCPYAGVMNSAHACGLDHGGGRVASTKHRTTPSERIFDVALVDTEEVLPVSERGG